MRKLIIASLIVAAAWVPAGSPHLWPAGLANAAACPTRAAAPAASINEKFDLWRGPTTLRGANIWQKRVFPDDEMGAGPVGPPYGQEDFDKLASWGANYVNISHPGIFTERGDYQIEEAVFQNLDQLINRAERAGLFVVVSYRTGPGRNEGVFGGDEGSVLAKVWKNQAAQNGWVEMWRETARRLKERTSVVGYDLMVEPETRKTGVWNRLAQRITRAIRDIDVGTPILIGGADWSTVDSLSGLQLNGDPRTIYTIHQYEPYDYSHQDARRATFTTDELQKLYDRIEEFKSRNGVPVAINEFGVERFAPDAGRFVATQMAMIEKLGANHALWLWETSFPLDYDEFNFRRGPDAKSHRDIEDSALIAAIKADWAKNVVHLADLKHKF
ncbi:MAG: hypothetical protein DMF60_02850 [Acidobacteria bacterium]|nr:MAG: hypothetical protein DMF60_02850 [Acidobacteriota bacterium]